MLNSEAAIDFVLVDGYSLCTQTLFTKASDSLKEVLWLLCGKEKTTCIKRIQMKAWPCFVYLFVCFTVWLFL